MNVRKKLGVIALVVMLAVCFCTMASAETLSTSAISATNSSTGIETLSFTSSLTSDGSYLAGDVVYTITTPAGGPIIEFQTDNENNVAASASTDSETDDTATVEYDAGSGTASKIVTMSLNASGAANNIYQYTIEQNTGTSFDDETTYDTAYLDVIVVGGKVTQAVLHTDIGTSGTYSEKVAGFEYTSAFTAGGDVTLQKALAGDFANLHANQNFVFTVEISASGNANLPISVTGEEGVAITPASGSSVSALTASGTASYTVTLSNATVSDASGKLTISGLPETATVTIVENDSTADSTNATGGSYTSSTKTDVVTVSDTQQDVVFTNTYEAISLTGVSLRYAPYLLTLGAGIVALPLTKSYRRREDF